MRNERTQVVATTHPPFPKANTRIREYGTRVRNSTKAVGQIPDVWIREIKNHHRHPHHQKSLDNHPHSHPSHPFLTNHQ
jgi:hypothetical protein